MQRAMTLVCGAALFWLLGATSCMADPPAETKNEARPPEHDLASPRDLREAEEEYFFVRPSGKNCSTDACSALVRKANQALTRCGDGALHEECSVRLIDLGPAALTDAARERLFQHIALGGSLLKGKMVPGAGSHDGAAVFEATSGWVTHGQPPASTQAFTETPWRYGECCFGGCSGVRLELVNHARQLEVEKFSLPPDEIASLDVQDSRGIGEGILLVGALEPTSQRDELPRLFIQNIYTSAALLGCDPDKVALETARSHFPAGAEIFWFKDDGQESQSRTTGGLPDYYVTVSSRGHEVVYRFTTPSSYKWALVDRKTCALTAEDPKTPKGIY